MVDTTFCESLKLDKNDDKWRCSSRVRPLSITQSQSSQIFGFLQSHLLWLSFFISLCWKDKAEKLNRIIPTFCWVSHFPYCFSKAALTGQGELCWQSKGSALWVRREGRGYFTGWLVQRCVLSTENTCGPAQEQLWQVQFGWLQGLWTIHSDGWAETLWMASMLIRACLFIRWKAMVTELMKLFHKIWAFVGKDSVVIAERKKSQNHSAETRPAVCCGAVGTSCRCILHPNW